MTQTNTHNTEFPAEPEPENQTYITRLSNPYPGFKQGDPTVKRISMDIPLEDAKLVQRIRFDHGTIILAARMFIRCLVQEARDCGWTCENEKEFEDFVLERTQTTKEKYDNHRTYIRTETSVGPSTSESPRTGPNDSDRSRASRLREDGTREVHVSTASKRKQTATRPEKGEVK